MKTNKKIIWLLGTVLVIVWGIIAYQVVAAIYFAGDEEVLGENVMVKSAGTRTAQFLYVENVRDPFRYFMPVKDTIKKSILKPLQTTVLPPPFRLTGIILNAKRRTAVIERQYGNVWFLQEKDTLNGLKVLKIKEKQVTYLYQKRKEVWNLQ